MGLRERAGTAALQQDREIYRNSAKDGHGSRRVDRWPGHPMHLLEAWIGQFRTVDAIA